MDQLEQDLRYFKLLLENERDQAQRNLILREIRGVEREIVRLVRQEQADLEFARDNMQIAIDKLNARKKRDDSL